MAGFIELYIDQGADWNSTLYFTDDNDNTSINVAGYQVAGSLKRSYYSQNVSANLVVTFTDRANGVVDISLPGNVSSNLMPANYVFDVVSKSPSEKVERVLEGIMIISPKVTNIG